MYQSGETCLPGWGQDNVSRVERHAYLARETG